MTLRFLPLWVVARRRLVVKKYRSHHRVSSTRSRTGLIDPWRLGRHIVPKRRHESRSIPEQRIPQLHCCGSLKFCRLLYANYFCRDRLTALSPFLLWGITNQRSLRTADRRHFYLKIHIKLRFCCSSVPMHHATFITGANYARRQQMPGTSYRCAAV